MIIAVDFDGTCVTHEFPFIGKEIGAVPVLKELVAKGHKLILFTMRDDKEGKPDENHLTQAIQWFEQHDIKLWGVQANPTQKHWTKSPKAYAELYIDYAALGCPLVIEPDVERPFVDWAGVRIMLTNLGVL